jgi:arsenite methyltransferase
MGLSHSGKVSSVAAKINHQKEAKVGIEEKVSERYAGGAKEVEATLCCPVDYDAELLKILPTEIIEKDYGCGDPSRYVEEGDCVLDLGSGGGKICYMAAQLVGDKGSVIGIDMTDEMLALARKYQQEMAKKLGGDRVNFRKGYIQDLALDLQALQDYKMTNPSAAELEIWQQKQKTERPLVASGSIDLVVSNCVLNLVAQKSRQHMIAEIYRVLKPGGRIAISDIVSDKIVPQHLQDDARLWSGCISGAYQEKSFLDAFLEAGFAAVAYDKWTNEPWQQIDDIEFRSVTVTAIKPAAESSTDKSHEVIYKGPYQQVADDLGNLYQRGERVKVDAVTLQLLSAAPFASAFVGVKAEKTRCCSLAKTINQCC